uniref:Ovule protein n=1 Tax=Ascaris lumbricoides TaxID=6252 RepID=A0A0M3I0L4_ASCLU
MKMTPNSTRTSSFCGIVCPTPSTTKVFGSLSVTSAKLPKKRGPVMKAEVSGVFPKSLKISKHSLSIRIIRFQTLLICDCEFRSLFT